ncbi:hypothetical protein A3E97_00485 [Candidatus Uhrbacteria bacterium RIFCSPHIGHO2_12_FULL_47_12]|nr:MAG: hypothetical protein A3E97_00485 [Candidatus Uhrbacteria bacterium RIFCSPHIGHO2_12_FULL_47_12]
MMLTHNEQRLQFVMDEYRTAAEKIATRVGHILERERERLVMINARLHDRAERWLPLLRESVESSARMLRQVDPTRILARGYAIVRIGGEVVKDASLLAIGREVAIQLGAGAVDAEVLRVNGKGKQKLV